MKYRMLTTEELHALEGDLKAFLIINGMDGDAWKQLNEQEPDKALALVELFSDNVLQTVYEKISYLEFRSADTCLVFKLDKEQQELIAVNRKLNSTVDLSTIDNIHTALVDKLHELDFFYSKKAYSKNREEEIHQMITQGCVLSVSEFWEALEKLVKRS